MHLMIQKQTENYDFLSKLLSRDYQVVGKKIEASKFTVVESMTLSTGNYISILDFEFRVEINHSCILFFRQFPS